MDSALILKVVGIGLLVAFSCQILSRSGRDGKIAELFNMIRNAFGI